LGVEEISHLDEDNLFRHGGNRKIYQVALKKNGMIVAVKQLDQGDGYIAPGML
jgi:hypothetical protein